MTWLLPSRSTATTSCIPQLENHKRPSCHRGDSPNARPVNRVCTAGSEDGFDGIITSSGQHNGDYRAASLVLIASSGFGGFRIPRPANVALTSARALMAYVRGERLVRWRARQR